MRRLGYALAAIILCYPPWAAAGVVAAAYHPVVWLAAGLLAATLWQQASASGHAASADARTQPLWTMPMFWVGLVFSLLLAMQWLNAGRTLYFDVGTGAWTYSRPRHPGWPSAFTRPEVAQMASWFFPAWTVVMALRSTAMTSREQRHLLHLVVWNAGAVALLGLAQAATGTKALLWILPLRAHFFATFGYANHAAQFFMLAATIAIGLLIRDIHRPPPLRHAWRSGVTAASAGLCLAGAHLSFSRLGIVLAWTIGTITLIHVFCILWPRFTATKRLNLGVSLAAACCLIALAVGPWGENTLRQEFAQRTPPMERLMPNMESHVKLDLRLRSLFAREAFGIWRENSWFGVGSSGFRYLLPLRLQEPARTQASTHFGWANVHCDPLQFLCEFGLVGGALLGAAWLLLVRPVIRAISPVSTWRAFPVAGLLCVAAWGWIDLPFRCPAILLTWTATAAVIGLAESKRTWANPHSPSSGDI